MAGTVPGGTPPMRRGLDQTVVPVRHSVLHGFRFAPGRRPCATDRPSPEPSICAFRQWLWQVAAVSGSGFGDALLHALLVERREPVGPERLPVRDVIG